MKKLLLILVVFGSGVLACSQDLDEVPFSQTEVSNNIESLEQLQSDPDTLIGTCSMCTGH